MESLPCKQQQQQQQQEKQQQQGSSLKIVTPLSNMHRKLSRTSLFSEEMDSDSSEPGGASSGSGFNSVVSDGKTVRFLQCMLDYFYRKREYDVDVAKSFLVVYQKYLDPETLLNFLIKEYHELESDAFKCIRGREFCNLPQLRLVNLMIIWMKMFAIDFNGDMLATLADFIDNGYHGNEGVFSRLSSMLDSVKQRLAETAAETSLRRKSSSCSCCYSDYHSPRYHVGGHRRSLLSPKGFDRISIAVGHKLVRKVNAEEHISRVLSTPNFIRIRLEDLDSTSIAEQITLIQWSIFSNIELRDVISFSLLGGSRGVSGKGSTSSSRSGGGGGTQQNLQNHQNSQQATNEILLDDEVEQRENTLNEHFKHFNFIADWVSTYILSFSDPYGRVQAIAKCIQIAMELRRLNNFSSLMAFIGGIYSPAIRRLKETQLLLKKRKKVYNDLVELSKYHNPSQSFGAYRKALRSCPIGAPCIPYLGVMTQDLLKINEGNPDFKTTATTTTSSSSGGGGGGESEPQVNIPKFKLIGELIEPWQRYKSVDYWSLGFVKMERLQAWIRSRHISSERELFQLSRMREP